MLYKFCRLLKGLLWVACSIILIIVSGCCGEFYKKTYSGPELSRNEIAILVCDYALMIDEVDDQPNPITWSNPDEIHFKPGFHSLKAEYVVYQHYHGAPLTINQFFEKGQAYLISPEAELDKMKWRLQFSNIGIIEEWDIYKTIARRRNIVKFKSLLAENPKLANAYLFDKTTPLLMIAVGQDEKDIVELLIANGADVNAKNNDNQTSLMLAVFKENIAIVKLLIDKGADVNAKDSYGKTVLSFAKHSIKEKELFYSPNKKIVELLEKAGAKE